MIDTLAVTGHRPDKLGGYDDHTFSCLVMFARIQLRKLQPAYVLTGMALGWDQAVATACIKTGVRYIACIPFRGQESVWPDHAQERYCKLCEKAYQHQYVCEPGYAAWKLHKRNEYMVDNADVLLALWNGTQGGTASCVEYADLKACETINCWSQWEKFQNPKSIRRRT